MGDGRMEQEVDRWFVAASEVIQTLRSSVAVKKEKERERETCLVCMPPGCLAVDM